MIKGFGSLNALLTYTSNYVNGKVKGINGEVYKQGQNYIFVSYDEYVNNNALFLISGDVDSLLCCDIADEEKTSILRFVGNLPQNIDGKDFLITTPGEKEMYSRVKNILLESEIKNG